MGSRLYDMSYPQYTVHDVSALTGLTPQTIRYYDGIGVVVPRRGAQGQRLYSYYDVLNLVRRSLYKAQGFSLQETEQVLSGAITSRLGALLEEKRADIEEKQRALRLARLNLDRMSAQLDRLGVCRGRVMYLERPASWHVPYSRDGHICFEEASRAAHSGCGIAFAFAFSLPAVGEPDDRADWDVTMPSPFAEELGFTALPGAVFVPARYCLYTVIETPGMDFLRREALRPLYDFVAQKDLTPEGMIYGRDIVNDVSAGVTLRYYEAWLPVRESEG